MLFFFALVVGYVFAQTASCPSPAGCAVGTCNSACQCNCTTCLSGYFLSAGKCLACTPIANCLNGWLTCTSATNSLCGYCPYHYYRANGGTSCAACGNCTSPQYNTASCNGTTFTDTHVCATCAATPGCALVSCASTGVTCTQCLPGFNLTTTGTCSGCATLPYCNTSNCSSGIAKCTRCNLGYYISSSGSCTACASCPSNQYLSTRCSGTTTTDTRVCKTCVAPTGCAAVSCSFTEITCSQCRQGYFLSGTTCKACTALGNCSLTNCTTGATVGRRCVTCKTGFYVNAGGTCTKCTALPNCSSTTCASPGPTCSQCQPGFYLSSGICTACQSATNCLTTTCTGLNAGTTCTRCSPGYYISSGKCVACGGCTAPAILTATCPGTTTTDVHTCSTATPTPITCNPPANCAAYSCFASVTNCTKCFDGYYVNAQAQCSPCSSTANCITTTCTTGPSTGSRCSRCQPNFYILNGVCRACAPCASGQIPFQNCSGYETTDNHTCGVCTLPNPTGCIEVTCGVGRGTCTRCAAGFQLSNGACNACPTPTNCLQSTCGGPSSGSCARCSPDYFINVVTGGCTACGVCNSPQYYTARCAGNETRDTHLCGTIQCYVPTGCMNVSCSPTSITCLSCLPNWYLSAGTCSNRTTAAATETTLTIENSAGGQTTTTISSGGSSGYSDGAVAGIVLGAVAGSVLLMLILAFALKPKAQFV